MLARIFRPAITAAFTPLAKLLHRLGVTPDMVTIFGTVASSALALWLIPAGHLLIGALVIALFALFDTVDGILARLTGSAGPWGAFLDSTLDRISDGAIFLSIALYFVFHPALDENLRLWGIIAALAVLILGSVVSYSKARAGSLGVDIQSGIFERATRLVFALVPLFLVQLGLPLIVFVIALTLLAVGTLTTIFQRMWEARRGLLEAPNQVRTIVQNGAIITVTSNEGPGVTVTTEVKS